MLFKRTCLMINYEDANRALDKAKPGKKSAVIFRCFTYFKLRYGDDAGNTVEENSSVFSLI